MSEQSHNFKMGWVKITLHVQANGAGWLASDQEDISQATLLSHQNSAQAYQHDHEEGQVPGHQEQDNGENSLPTVFNGFGQVNSPGVQYVPLPHRILRVCNHRR